MTNYHRCNCSGKEVVTIANLGIKVEYCHDHETIAIKRI